MNRKDLLGLKELSASEINEILDETAKMKLQFAKKDKKSSLLNGVNVTSLFYENSTRTKNSFETAAKFLGASTSYNAASTSAVTKGETLIDTGKNLDALLTDVIVIRHPMAGAPHHLAKNVKASVINGGDGRNEHPTQALLDIFTMREKLKSIKGLRIVMCGDIKFSRVARSNVWGLTKLGATVTVCAPYTLIPSGIEKLGCSIECNPKKAVKDADVIMGLRIQNERQSGGMFPSISEYAKNFSVNMDVLSGLKKEVLVMHPGPINRGVELSDEVADSKNSVILEQVTNGVAVRMAVLSLLVNK